MNRQRLLIFSFLTLVFVGVSFIYFLRIWEDSTNRFRTGLPVPRSILPEELLRPEEIIPKGPPRQPEIRADDPVLAGSDSSPVTLMVFGDFQCEYCRDQAVALDEALRLAEAENKVRVVWRDFPLVEKHPRASAAAVAAYCASKQGRFRQMHNSLFFEATDLSEAEIYSFATKTQLDANAFLVCQRDPAVTTRLRNDLTEARNHAILEVPLMFVNGQPIEGYVDAQTLASILRRQLDVATP